MQVYNNWTPEEIALLRELYGTRTKREIHALIPKHSPGSIVMKAIKIGIVKTRAPYNSWTKSELALLMSMYPNDQKTAVLRAIPAHSWCSIQEKAKKLGVSRFWRTHRARKRSRIPVIAALRERRIQLKLPAKDLADRLGYSRNHLHKWELAVYMPRFQNLLNWCEALGVELTIQPKEP